MRMNSLRWTHTIDSRDYRLRKENERYEFEAKQALKNLA